MHHPKFQHMWGHCPAAAGSQGGLLETSIFQDFRTLHRGQQGGRLFPGGGSPKFDFPTPATRLPHGSHVAPIPTLPLPSPSTDGLSACSVAQRRRRARERVTTTHSSITLEPVIRCPANRVEHDATEARLEPPTNPTIAQHKENDVLIRVHPQRRRRATERGTTTLNSTTVLPKVLPVASSPTSPAEHNVDQSRMEIATNPTVTTHHKNDRNSSFLSPTLR